jgi:hypothetical protein
MNREPGGPIRGCLADGGEKPQQEEKCGEQMTGGKVGELHDGEAVAQVWVGAGESIVTSARSTEQLRSNRSCRDPILVRRRNPMVIRRRRKPRGQSFAGHLPARIDT